MDHRIDQINELIKRELCKLFLKEIDFPSDCLVTITKVETSKDLEQAKVWVSILPIDNQGKILGIINKNLGHLQHLLAQILVMRQTPKLIIKQDATEQEAARIDELLNQISQERPAIDKFK